MVEHTAVNRGVVGSSPTRGACKNPVNTHLQDFFANIFKLIKSWLSAYCDYESKQRIDI